jgi:hypothetical protein
VEGVRTFVAFLAAIVTAGGSLGLVFGLLRLRRSRRDGAQLVVDLLAELVANRVAISSWWRGELRGSSRPRALPTLATALRNGVYPTRTPREWRAALHDAHLEHDVAVLYDEFARVKRGETLISSDWEQRLDDAAVRVRRPLARRRLLDVLVGAWYRVPPLPNELPSAPESPAELQRRALSGLDQEAVQP